MVVAIRVRVIGPVIAVRPVVNEWVRIGGAVIIVVMTMSPVIRVAYRWGRESQNEQSEQAKQ
jgi:hypothetical protein